MGIEPIFDAHNWELVPFHFWSLVFFVFGCMVGSFLNVCIHRLPRGMSIITPPSHCPHCQYAIPWYLNVPLVTWLALRGRCRNCGAPISPRYFVVELLTGVTFLSCWLAFGKVSPVIAIIYAIFFAGLIAATFIDFEHLIIPDEITYGGMAIGLVVSFLFPSLHDVRTLTNGMWQSVLGMGAGAGIIYAILRLGKLMFGRERLKWPADTKVIFTETSVHLPDREIPYNELFYRQSDVVEARAKTVEMIDRSYFDAVVRLSRSSLEIDQDGFKTEKFDPESIHHMEIVGSEIVLPREAMGMGDVKFMGAIGAFVGWQGVIFSLMLSSVIGSIVGVTLILMQRKEWSSKIPYGPYIALAAAIWIFGGKEIIHTIFQ